MTEPTRTRLLRVAAEALIRARIFSFHEQKVEAVLDAILDELMEPGEGAIRAGEDSFVWDELPGCERLKEADAELCWQAMLTAVREEK